MIKIFRAFDNKVKYEKRLLLIFRGNSFLMLRFNLSVYKRAQDKNEKLKIIYSTASIIRQSTVSGKKYISETCMCIVVSGVSTTTIEKVYSIKFCNLVVKKDCRV